MKRIPYEEINQRALDLILSSKKHVASVDNQLRVLIEIRVSQINGCAFCVDMHSSEARELAVDPQKLDCLVVWRESQLFSEAEMAALDWAETITRISTESGIEDKLRTLLTHYSEKEVVDLTFMWWT